MIEIISRYLKESGRLRESEDWNDHLDWWIFNGVLMNSRASEGKKKSFGFFCLDLASVEPVS